MAAVYDELVAISRTHLCHCDRELTVAWKDGEYKLRCPDHLYNPETRLRYSPSLRKRFEQGEQLDSIERQTLERQLKKEIRQAEAEGQEPRLKTVQLLELLEAMMQGQSRALVQRERRELLTEEEAMRFIDLAKPKGLGELKDAMLAIMQATGLDPRIPGEITVYEGKLWVGAPGLYKIAAAEPTFVDSTTRFLTEKERQDQGYIHPRDIVAEVTIRTAKPIAGQLVVTKSIGTAKANPEKPFRNNAVETTHPQRMAEHRAFRHAFVKVYQGTLSGYHVELAGEELESAWLQGKDLESLGDIQDAEYRMVDTETGEITDLRQIIADMERSPDERAAYDPTESTTMPANPPVASENPVAEAKRQYDSEQARLASILNPCPVHGMDWRANKNPTWPWSHVTSDKDDAGKTIWCGRTTVLNNIVRQEVEELGLTPDAMKATLQAMFGDGVTSSKLKDEERARLILWLRAEAEKRAMAADPTQTTDGGGNTSDAAPSEPQAALLD